MTSVQQEILQATQFSRITLPLLFNFTVYTKLTLNYIGCYAFSSIYSSGHFINQFSGFPLPFVPFAGAKKRKECYKGDYVALLSPSSSSPHRGVAKEEVGDKGLRMRLQISPRNYNHI